MVQKQNGEMLKVDASLHAFMWQGESNSLYPEERSMRRISEVMCKAKGH